MNKNAAVRQQLRAHAIEMKRKILHSCVRNDKYRLDLKTTDLNGVNLEIEKTDTMENYR
jgi:hypothetical protein